MSNMNCEKAIVHKTQLRPRYGEVDRMGYVYHANYVSYCHVARTELLREYGIHDNMLEKNSIMMPVITMNLRFVKPAQYDELLTIRTIIREIPEVRFKFEFEIRNEANEKICVADSTTVFVDSLTRKPMRIPKIIEGMFKNDLEFSQQ
jgi:acyl-CoA thioester hydrolase